MEGGGCRRVLPKTERDERASARLRAMSTWKPVANVLDVIEERRTRKWERIARLRMRDGAINRPNRRYINRDVRPRSPRRAD